MFTHLIDGARELRAPLAVGGLTLFGIWVCTHDRLPERSDADPAQEAFHSFWDAIGSGGQVALIAFAAVLLGGLIQRIAIDPALGLLHRAWPRPPWQLWIEQAEGTVRRYEENQDRQGNARSPSVSAAHSQTLSDVVAGRRRRMAEADLRDELALAVVFPVVALATRGGGAWYWLLALVPLIILDMAVLDASVDKQVRASLRRELQEELSRFYGYTPTDARGEHDLDEYIAELESQLEELERTKTLTGPSSWLLAAKNRRRVREIARAEEQQAGHNPESSSDG